MESKKESLKKLVEEAKQMEERMNNVVKHIKPVDTSKVVLTSAPFVPKKVKTALVK
jgi:RNA-splicing ligase RtcB